ncbi:serine/arginine-rich splicing factor 2-like [Carlito syrichta]|uniref:Serine/arginine-rich splicing factor 2 n=1 Tax=Carlito syrichta TaxID=1868482 RepID=A0A1U7U9B2_CARSF|nr:serine/arginine-rich splicing factor 2-like [Carlito syrichta]
MSFSRPLPNVEGMTSLKVDNLTYRTSTNTLRRVFQKYGSIGDVYIPRDRVTKEVRGFAFIRFHHKHHAEDAREALDGMMLYGRELRVQMAHYDRPRDPSRSRFESRRRSPLSPPKRESRSHSQSRSQSRSRSRYSSRSSSSSSSSFRFHCHSRARSPSTSRSQSTQRSKSKSFSVARSSLLTRSSSRSRSFSSRYKKKCKLTSKSGSK